MAARKRYYDPGAKPFPTKKVWSPAMGGPIGKTRQQRRARGRLPFEEQMRLAAWMGFATPELIPPTGTAQAAWILVWERSYADR